MVQKKILAIMERVKYLQKDDKVSYKDIQYKAMSEEKVTSMLRQEIIKERLVIYPIDQTWSREGNISHVDTTYRIWDTEDDTYIDVVSCGDGYDTQDKGSGKAMTYAYKYMWLRTFAIPTGEDPDKISSAEIDAKEVEIIRKKPISATKVRAINNQCEKDGVNVDTLCALYQVTELSKLTEEQYSDIVNSWSKKVVPTCAAR